MSTRAEANGSNLEHHVAVVSGAGGPMGRAIALELAGQGYAVAVLDALRDPADETVAEIQNRNGRGTAVVADITVMGEIRRAFDEIGASLGLAEVLINSAGSISLGPFEDISEAEWDRIFDVNLKAVFFLTQEFARRTSAVSQEAAVVNIGSVAAKRVIMNRAHFCASKAGVLALTKGQALELAPLGIRVNCVNPMAIGSGMAGGRVSAVDGTSNVTEGGWIDFPEQKQIVVQSLPMDDQDWAEDIAHTVSFLVSSSSSWITGANVDVDGGYLAGDMLTL